MPPTFQRLDVGTFGALLQKFHFTRRITGVHVHHTWRPRRTDFRGHDTIVAMWRYHTQTNGWRDIGQHLTLDPQGFIWLGRNWNLPPCSAPKANGNSVQGPLMVEVVGDFDTGAEKLDGAQQENLCRLIALIDRRFGLAPNSLRFHREFVSYKSCPGTSVDKPAMVSEVAAALRALEAPAAASRSAGEATDLDLLLRSMERPVPDRDDPEDADPDEGDGQRRGIEDAALLGARAFGPGDGSLGRSFSGLGPSELAALKSHLVNISCGRLSVGGEVSTMPADLDQIFGQHLPEAAERASEAGQPLRVLLYAHGGLVGEGDGLRIAHKHVAWWLGQEPVIYPLYFVWETGLLEIVGQQLLGSRPRALSDLTDAWVEDLCRRLGPRHVWSGMKDNARRSIDEPTASDRAGGAAREVARRLAEFHAAQVARGRQIEYHAVGHSAGSIFHAWLLPLACEAGLPPVKTLQLLAPAIRTDLFKDRLLDGDRLGACAQQLTVYTMSREYELRDTCARLYRKSLLYLIHHALEPERGAALLGLEESIKADPALARALGVSQPSDRAAVVWARTDQAEGRAASRSTSHGGFDDDAPTMTSVLRRVLDVEDDAPVRPYTPLRPAGRGGDGIVTRDLEDETPPAEPMISPAARPPVTPGSATHTTGAPSSGGRKRALCVGIDAYERPEHRLDCCVADAKAWSAALGSLNFSTQVLADGEATRATILNTLNEMLLSSRPGDVLVWHYSGHGTQVPDLDDDESKRQGKPAMDQALVPFDYAGGQLLIDDELRELFLKLPAGVALTVFMDCCHSFSNTRAFPPPGAKRRSFVADAALVDAYRAARTHEPRHAVAGQLSRSANGAPRQPYAKFAACKDTQEALEMNGHGLFTRHALDRIAAGIDGLTNQDFRDAIVAAFGEDAQQDPGLDEETLGAWVGGLLQPIAQAAAASPGLVTTQPPRGGTSVHPVAATEANDASAWATLASLARAAEALARRGP